MELAVFIALAFQVRMYAVMDLAMDKLTRSVMGVALILTTGFALAVIYAALHAIGHGGSDVTRFIVNTGLSLSLVLLAAQLVIPFLLRGSRPRAWQYAVYALLLVAICVAGPLSLR